MTDEFYPYKEMSTEDLLQHYASNNMGTIVWEQVKHELKVNEDLRHEEDIKILIEENVALGGSTDGYYCDNQLFAIGSTYNSGDISPIHESLYMRADAIKENGFEIVQDSTYIGNFLSVAQGMTDNILVFLSNLPIELFKFSTALQKLERYANEREDGWRERYRRDPDQAEFMVFYQHFNRIEPPLKRYLFRKLTT